MALVRARAQWAGRIRAAHRTPSMSNKEIARSLDIGPETVKSHLKSVFTKLGVERRAQAVSRAQSMGLVTTR